MNNEELINSITEEAKKHFTSSRGSHDWSHTERVYRLALHISEAEGGDLLVLSAAALLHDVGKLEHYPRLWERVFTVLIEYGAPNLASRMALGPPKGLRRGLVVRRFHADWGADLAARAGASYRVLFLIRKHHSAPGGDAELTALQAIDDDGYVSE